MMKKLIPGLIAIACIGLAFGYWTETTSRDHASAAGVRTDDSQPAADIPNSLQARMLALERAVSIERDARQLLQEEVLILTDELNEFRGGGVMTGGTLNATIKSTETQISRGEFRNRNRSGDPAERLVAVGFSQIRADWILRRESEVQMESLQARYDAQREGTLTDYYESRRGIRDALREELGDADYERYLEANGSSTGITISSVLESSPALLAGLHVGDEIVNYDGQRIFSVSDLTRETLQGNVGQSVTIDIVRDGVPMQVVLPRGPVGITGGRRFGTR